jgi:hypothetical protein
MSSQNICIQSRSSFVSRNLPDKPRLVTNCHIDSLSMKTSRWSSNVRTGTSGGGRTDRLRFFGDSKGAGGGGAGPGSDSFNR